MKKSLTIASVLGLALLCLIVVLSTQERDVPAITAEPEGQAPVPVVKDEARIIVELPVREVVQRLAGEVDGGELQIRREALEVLPKDLNATELALIYKGVLHVVWADGRSLRDWHAFYNDTLNALVLDQETPVADLPTQLSTILQDENRHRVIRDYALQHLLAFAEYRASDGERAKLLEQTWEAVPATRDSYRGTYLVAVSYRSGEPGWPTTEVTSQRAWEVASSEDAHVLSRITALQICGRLGHRDALPLAKEIAEDRKAHMTLRTSAIATIGDLGAEQEYQFLNQLAERSPKRLQPAIKAAAGRIKSKTNQV